MAERHRITIRHPMWPLGLFLSFCAVVIGLFLSTGGGVWIAVGLVEMVGLGWLGLRLYNLSVGVRGDALVILNFVSTTRVPVYQVQSIGFRTRPGAYGISKWVAYLAKTDGTGLWLWATEAGRASGPPKASVVDRVTTVCHAIGQDVAEPLAG